MSIRLFDKGRAALAGASNWLTDTINAMQIALSATDVAIKAITAASNATPIVITSTAHGFANGDVVVQQGVGGNLAANGTFVIANVAANTYELQTVKDAQNTTGSAAYTSGGTVINLTIAAATTDVDAGRNGTDQALGSKTNTNGILDAADPTFTTISGVVDALVIYDSTTSIPLIYIDGKQQVIAAANASSSATTLFVEPLIGPIANGVTFTMSNGVLVTLTAGAVAGARSLTVSALPGAITAGHSADVATTGAGLPFTGGGGSYTYQFDNGANKIIKI